MTGEPFTQEELDFDASGNLSRFVANGVTGQTYSSYAQNYVAGVYDGAVYTVTAVPSGATYAYYELDYNDVNAFTGQQTFYNGSAALGYAQEEVDTDASGDLAASSRTG